MLLVFQVFKAFLFWSALAHIAVIAIDKVESDDATKKANRFLLGNLFSSIEIFWNRLTLGLEERFIDHDGLTRAFLEHRPSSFPETGGSLVLLLHGGLGFMDGLFSKLFPGNRRWVTVSDNEGFLLLAPNAATPDGAGFVWNILREGEAIKSDVDDVGFLSSLVQWAIQKRGVDPSRVYITGFSDGGDMLYRMLIEKSDVFAAGVAFIANLPATTVPNAAGPTPIMIMNGTKDKVHKWEGGLVATGRGSVRSALSTRDYWIDANKADAAEVVRTELPDLDPFDGCHISLESYTSGEAPVLFYSMEGGGHVLPNRDFPIGFFQGFKSLSGHPCRDVEGADLAWSFMSSYG